MFDISFLEILIISVVALIVVGPERLPQVARTLGHLFARCRSYVYGIKTDIHNEIRMEELKKMHASVQESAQTIEDTFRQELDQLKSTADVESLEKTLTAVKTEVNTPLDSPLPSSPQQQKSEASEQMQRISDKDQK